MVKAFHSSLHESIQKPKNQNSIHNFMTHPEFTIDEEGPRTPLLDEQEEEIFEKVSKPGTKMSSPGGEDTPETNENNSSVDCSRAQIVASHSDSPLHSMETSV